MPKTREERSHQAIDYARSYVDKTGLCAVCRSEPAKGGVTCKGEACVRKWMRLRPRLPEGTAVVHCARDRHLVEAAKEADRYVYVGRPKGNGPWHWGNPFSSKEDTKAARVVDDPLTSYRRWLLGKDHVDLMQEERAWQARHLSELKGMVLGCWCAPAPCHGDVLRELVEDELIDLEALAQGARAPGKQKGQDSIRGLTLHRPWAFLVVRPDVTDPAERRDLYERGEGKAVENRSWKPYDSIIGRYVAIHAGNAWDDSVTSDFLQARGVAPALLEHETRAGVIIGVARVAGYVEKADEVDEAQRHWFFGPYGWLLEEITPIAPVKCRGYQGLWRLPAGVLARVRRSYQERKV